MLATGGLDRPFRPRRSSGWCMTSAGNWTSGATPIPRPPMRLARRPESPPELAVVECDGGRIRTREPGHGPGVHRSGEGLA